MDFDQLESDLKVELDVLYERIKYSSDDEIIDDILILLNLTNLYIGISSHCIPEEPIEKKRQGLLTGHIVRIGKILDELIFLFSKNKFDIALLLSRIVIEGCIVYEYIHKFGSDALYDNIINKSLYSEKKTFSKLRQKHNDFFMKNWFNAFKSKLDNLGKKQNDARKELSLGLPDIKTMTDKLNKNDLYYDVGYVSLSGLIHGSWHCLITYYLQEDSNYYKPRTDSVYTSPFPFFLICQECLRIAVSHLHLYSEGKSEIIIQKIDNILNLSKKLSQLAAAHDNRA